MKTATKTIKQVADEIGVSKQALEKRISRNALKSKLHGHVSKDIKGINIIDEEGVQIIKEVYEYDYSEEPHTDSNIAEQLEDSISKHEAVNTAIAALVQQLEAKDRQISELTGALATAQRTALAAQRTAESAQLLHAATMRTIIETTETTPATPSAANEPRAEPTRGFWASVFGKRK